VAAVSAAEDGADPARDGERDQYDRDARRNPPCGWREQDRQQRQHRAEGERERGGPGRLPGAGEVFGVDRELGVEVGGERVVLGELAGDGARGLRAQALGFVGCREFGELQLGVLTQLAFLGGELGFSESRWLDTDTYSPSAIDTAPATRPAMPAVNSGPRSVVTPATPTTSPATDTMPSLAPSTPARSQFSRDPKPAPCCSPGWWRGLVRTAPPAAWIRRPVTPMRAIALASSPESVG
jgi:hypothetical protein